MHTGRTACTSINLKPARTTNDCGCGCGLCDSTIQCRDTRHSTAERRGAQHPAADQGQMPDARSQRCKLRGVWLSLLFDLERASQKQDAATSEGG
eukprot:scaffold17338_cov145-Isochrysis_galbana.AAC.3